VEIVDEPRSGHSPAGIRLPGKDVPILMAAIESAASYLLTGDREHSGAYFDKIVEGVHILRPAIYLKLRRQ
jgi:hypothetical protein